MTLQEMHTWFRQYAQQMGMQNVRAILPEQIDLVINTSIDDTVNQIIKENISVANDRIVSDNSKIGQINALSTLYSVKEYDCFPVVISDTLENLAKTSYEKGTYVHVKDRNITFRCLDLIHGYDIEEQLEDPEIIDFDVNPLFKFNSKNAYIGNIYTENIISDYLYLVDFNLNYVSGKELSGLTNDNTTNIIKDNLVEFITNYYPVRLIDDSYLADSLNDFVLKNRFRSPILSIYNIGDVTKFDLYIDKFTKKGDEYFLPNKLLPYKFRVSYIAKPAHVQYNEDANVPNVECNLPDYLHVDILKHAVDLYRLAVGGQVQQQQTPSNQ